MALSFWKKTYPLHLHNTLTGKKEEVVPLHGKKIAMYNCGPTVYNYAHIGNLRSYIFADILKRTLSFNGYNVKQVINITDVGHLVSDADSGEDKMTKALKREGKELTLEAMKEVADFYTEKFKDDLQTLNIETGSITFPKASEHIKEQIDIISKLEKKGFTYNISDGVYFDATKFNDYGKLGNIKQSDDHDQSRIGVNTEKKHSQDFALWKFDTKLGWESPWGKGFPGWHIECSAMSMKYLGETFDIHTGGIDHIPVHHNNEIAQSESATGKPYARYWLHNAHVIIEGGKMAKSGDNFIQLRTLTEKGIHPLSYRYFLLGATYRTQMNFTWDALYAAETTYKRLLETVNTLGPKTGSVSKKYKDQFRSFVSDDLNTPKALALVWELVKDNSVSDADKKATLFAFDEVLGLNLKTEAPELFRTQSDIPASILELAEKRKAARANKDWKLSDELRNEITSLGYRVEDKEGEQKITKI